MGKIWKVNIYAVPPEKSEEHDNRVKAILKRWKEISPEKQFWYFRKRFGPYNGRIMILAGYDSISDWEKWLKEKIHTDEGFPDIAKGFYATLNQDSWDNVFWEEIPVE